MPLKAPDLPSTARQRILSGARRYFFAQGFRGVTMDELAGELGMSKKTLYAHFPSKMDLLKAVVAYKLATVEADLGRAVAAAANDFPARLQGLLGCLRSHTEEISEAYLRDVRREAPELFQCVQEGRRALIQRFFGSLLQEGRKAGRIRRDIPEPMMIEMLIGAVDAVVNPVKMNEMGMTPRTAFHHIITIFLEGVLLKDGVNEAKDSR